MRHTLLFLVIAHCGNSPPNPPAPPPSAAPMATSVLDAATPALDTVDAAAAQAPADTASQALPEPIRDDCAPIAIAYETSLRPKLRKCWSDAANKSKDRIIGSVRFVLEIDGTGKIATQKLAEKSDLPEPIVKCMTKAFKAEPMDTKKCGFKTITIAEKFPR